MEEETKAIETAENALAYNDNLQLNKKFLIGTFQILPTSLLTNFIFSQRKKKGKSNKNQNRKKNLSVRPKIPKQNIHIHTHIKPKPWGPSGTGVCPAVWSSCPETLTFPFPAKSSSTGGGTLCLSTSPSPCWDLYGLNLCTYRVCCHILCEFMYVICHIWKTCFYV